MEKVCKGCDELMTLDRFGKNSGYKDGLQPKCRDCVSDYKASRHLINRKNDRARYQKDPRPKQSSKLKSKYGITLDDYNSMVREQGGACAICFETPETLVVDHCHSSSKVRGLLCDRCNVGLGMFTDANEKLESAMKYLSERGA